MGSVTGRGFMVMDDELCSYESNENNAWEIYKAGFAFIENPVGACSLALTTMTIVQSGIMQVSSGE
jgi:hypothetical protein